MSQVRRRLPSRAHRRKVGPVLQDGVWAQGRCETGKGTRHCTQPGPDNPNPNPHRHLKVKEWIYGKTPCGKKYHATHPDLLTRLPRSARAAPPLYPNPNPNPQCLGAATRPSPLRFIGLTNWTPIGDPSIFSYPLCVALPNPCHPTPTLYFVPSPPSPPNMPSPIGLRGRSLHGKPTLMALPTREATPSWRNSRFHLSPPDSRIPRANPRDRRCS